VWFLLFVLATKIVPAEPKQVRELPRLRPRAQVLLLGTFHFQDAGADDYKPKFKVEVFSSTRQKEIALLLDLLAGYKPTKIAVEWPTEGQADLNEAYRKYLAGQLGLEANEIYQLGFRLAKRFGHQQLFAIDARSRWYDMNVSTELLIQRAQQNKQLDLLERGQAWDAAYSTLSERQDQLKTRMSILDFLVYLNSPAKLRVTLGQYLVGEIEVGGNGDYYGADMRTAWYNRNLRIYSNIQRIPLRTDERILVIIGQGHVPILQHLVENSPEFKLAAINSYLKPRVRARRR